MSSVRCLGQSYSACRDIPFWKNLARLTGKAVGSFSATAVQVLKEQIRGVVNYGALSNIPVRHGCLLRGVEGPSLALRKLGPPPARARMFIRMVPAGACRC